MGCNVKFAFILTTAQVSEYVLSMQGAALGSSPGPQGVSLRRVATCEKLWPWAGTAYGVVYGRNSVSLVPMCFSLLPLSVCLVSVSLPPPHLLSRAQELSWATPALTIFPLGMPRHQPLSPSPRTFPTSRPVRSLGCARLSPLITQCPWKGWH